MRTYVAVAAATILLWEIFPLRKWFFYIKSVGIGTAARVKLFYIFKVIGKYGTLFRMIADFFAFYCIFLWNHGIVAEKVRTYTGIAFRFLRSQSIEWFYRLLDFTILLLPFWRELLENNRFHYAFSACTVCTVLCTAASAFLAWSTSSKHFILRGAAVVLLFLGMINAVYFACRYIILIPFYYKLLAIIASVAASIIIWVIALLPFSYVMYLLDQ